MRNRWVILGVLFAVRAAMGFQFQSVAALTPYLADAYGAGLSQIGLLIGLYLAPGIVVAIPGGAIAARLGDARVISASLALMFAGGALALVAPVWGAALAGRVVAGIGGVVVNVVLTKMVVDWFAGREVSTALAIFVNSWPVGIALALLILPPLAEGAGPGAALAATLAVVAAVFVPFAALYRPAPQAGSAAPGPAARRAFPALPLLLAGYVWAVYNAALAMVFGFGAAALSGRGWTVTDASALTSGFMVAVALAVPLGGVLADRTGRRDAVIAIGLAGYAALVPAALSPSPLGAAALLLVSGGFAGLAAGPIMALPSAVLPAEARAFGMGVFFSIYYAVMTAAPGLAGRLADASGDAGIVFLLGAGMAASCLVALALFRRAGAAIAA